MENIKEEQVFKIGNVEFTTKGVKVVMPYNDIEKGPKDQEEARRVFNMVKDCIKNRLENYTKKLEENVVKSKYRTVTGMVIFDDGTYFSIDSAQAMQSSLNKDYFTFFNDLEFNQAIRAVSEDITMTPEQKSMCMDSVLTYQDEYINFRNHALYQHKISEFNDCLAQGRSTAEIACMLDL